MSLVENGKLSCGHDCGELDEYCHACVQEIYAKARELATALLNEQSANSVAKRYKNMAREILERVPKEGGQ